MTQGVEKWLSAAGRSIDMRLSYLSTVSLLAVVFSTLEDGDCAHPGTSGEKSVRQGSSNSPSHGEPLSKKPSLKKDIREDTDMPGGAGDLMEIDKEPLPSKEKPTVLGISREAVDGNTRDDKPGGAGDPMELEEEPLPAKKKPKVLGINREAFDGNLLDDKYKLTETLTAEQWNELLEKFWDEGKELEDNVSIIFYTLNYDEDRRLGMLKKALEGAFKGKLGYLFTAMCHLAYVPDTPK